MEDVGNPFKSIAPTSPIPLVIDYTILVNATPTDASKVKIVEST